ncbi:transposase [Rhodovulum sulfidophilum]|nr:transposase [Rhodovulum sulfidophilum]
MMQPACEAWTWLTYLRVQFRYGDRRIVVLLRRASWQVNHKRVARIWRREALKVPHKQKKRGRLWLNDDSCVQLKPEHKGIALAHIQPGKPQRNAYVERYNRTGRHEGLDLHLFETIDEVQQIATEWLWSYNNERPYMGNGGMTPAQKLNMAA